MENHIDKLEQWAKRLSWVVGIAFVGLLVLFLAKTSALDRELPIDSEIFDHFGSIVGGVLGGLLSFIGILYLVVTLRTQELDSTKTQIENRFFQLLQIHRENVAELEIGGKKGRAVFNWMFRELQLC